MWADIPMFLISSKGRGPLMESVERPLIWFKILHCFQMNFVLRWLKWGYRWPIACKIMMFHQEYFWKRNTHMTWEGREDGTDSSLQSSSLFLPVSCLSHWFFPLHQVKQPREAIERSNSKSKGKHTRKEVCCVKHASVEGKEEEEFPRSMLWLSRREWRTLGSYFEAGLRSLLCLL